MFEQLGFDLHGGVSIFTDIGGGRTLTLRSALTSDIPTLERWDLEPHVISASSDNRDLEKAFGDDHDWAHELDIQDGYYQYFVAELDGRPIGAMQICDPYNERTHYWGDIEPNLRALDIWIGDAADHGKGYGEWMMRLALQLCFQPPEVTAILIDPLNSNARAHKFYQRLGFTPTHRQIFNGEDDCLVHKLTRADWEAKR